MRVVNLFSGSSGNCTYIKCGGAEILIDAGGSAKKITDALWAIGTGPENIDAIFVTHEHTDHISAIRVLEKKYVIPVYISGESARFSGLYGTVDANRLLTYDGVFSVRIRDAVINGFEVPHDSAFCYGFAVCGEGHKIGVVTDMGTVTEQICGQLCGCDIAVIEANHDREMLMQGPYPPELKERILSGCGHLSNDSCGELARILEGKGLRRLMLAHLSEENNRPDVAVRTVMNYVRGDRLTVVAASACGPTELYSD